MDVVAAFQYGNLDQYITMEESEGLKDKSQLNMLYRLLK